MTQTAYRIDLGRRTLDFLTRRSAEAHAATYQPDQPDVIEIQCDGWLVCAARGVIAEAPTYDEAFALAAGACRQHGVSLDEWWMAARPA